MLSYILQFTVCLSVFYLLYILILSRETFFAINRWYLLGTLMLSVVLPLMPAMFTTAQPAVVMTTTLEPIVIGIQDVSTTLSTAPSQPLWLSLLLVLYWVGVSALTVRFILGLKSIWQIYNSRTEVRHSGSRRIVFSEQTRVPFSFFNWIFLPDDHRLPDEELKEIVAHESAHARAFHSVDVLIVQLACILLWPSPVIYLYRKSLRRIHEYLADAVVLQRTPVRRYGRLLLSRAVPGMQLALANHFFQNQLKHRIIMMTRNKSHRIALIKYAAVIPVVLIALSLVAFRGAEGEAQTNGDLLTSVTDSVPQQGEVYKVVEEMPRFPGCEDAGLSEESLSQCAQKKMLEYIYTRVKYPAEARKAGISGTVMSEFVVTADGSVRNARILRSPGHGLDAAVLEVVETMPQWRPGYQDGRAVNVQLVLPVSFKLPARTTPEEGEIEEVAPSPASESAREKAAGAVYKVVEEMPRFPGCEDAASMEEKRKCSNEKLFGYIMQSIKYPEEARKAGYTGKTIVSFIVRADGTVADPRVLKALGYGMDKQVVDAINAMPRWIPGKHKGKAVDIQMTLPVTFALPASDKADTRESADAGTLTLEVFPVPTGEQLNYSVELKRGTGEMKVELISHSGQRVKHDAMNIIDSKKGTISGSLDVRGVAPGTYVLRVSWNEQSESRSVVIQ